MKKKIIIWAVLTLCLLCGCTAHESKQSGTQSKKSSATPAAVSHTAAVGMSVYAGEDDYWREKLKMKNPQTKKDIVIDINAQIKYPEVTGMSVIEAHGLKREPKSTERPGKESVGEIEYRWWSDEAEDSEEYTEQEIAPDVQKKLTKKLLNTEAAKGNKDFTVTYEDSSVDFKPVNNKRVVPDEFKGDGKRTQFDILWPDGGAEKSIVEKLNKKKNSCNLSKEEARKKAEDFLSQAGYEEQALLYTAPLTWNKEGQKYDGDENSWDTGKWNGYCFVFAPVTAYGEPFAYNYRIFYQADNKYTRECISVLCVTDRGVIYAKLAGPLKILHEKKQVKLLSMDKIKERFRAYMKEYMDKYFERAEKLEYGKGGSEDLKNLSIYKFNKLQLVYFRVENEEDPELFSYLPAWKLSMYFDYAMVEECMFINAIDGTLLDGWEGIRLPEKEQAEVIENEQVAE